jgi:UDP-N-acetylmuramate-alanine ligase
MQMIHEMKKVARVMWAGALDKELHQLIKVFSVANSFHKPGPYARSFFFDENTVETLCDAVVKAEDTVVFMGAGENVTFHIASILGEAEISQLFCQVHH